MILSTGKQGFSLAQWQIKFADYNKLYAFWLLLSCCGFFIIFFWCTQIYCSSVLFLHHKYNLKCSSSFWRNQICNQCMVNPVKWLECLYCPGVAGWWISTVPSLVIQGMLTIFQQCNFSLEFPEILSQNVMLLLNECVRDFQYNALWDTH